MKHGDWCDNDFAYIYRRPALVYSLTIEVLHVMKKFKCTYANVVCYELNCKVMKYHTVFFAISVIVAYCLL